MSVPRVNRLPQHAHESERARDDRHFVTALARGLQLLNCFESAEERLGNQDLAERCRLPKSTVSRLAHTLVELGYLNRLPENGQFRLGVRTLGLAGRTLDRLDVIQVGVPLMRALVEQTGAAVSLGIRDDLSMLYIATCRGRNATHRSLDVGSRIPLVPTAMGRAYLGTLSTSARSQLERRLQSLDQSASRTTQESISEAVACYAREGCGASFEEWHAGVNAIAVIIKIGAGLPTIVMNAVGPAAAFSRNLLLNEIRPRLVEVSFGIEQELRRRRL